MGRDEIERLIGPVEATLPARPPFGWGPALVGAAALLFAFAGGLLDVNRPGGPGRFGPYLFAMAALLTALVLAGLLVRRDRLHVGARGLAEERDDAVTVVHWSELGKDWQPLPSVAVGFEPPPLLVLMRGDGRLFRLRRHYVGVEGVARRIRDHLRRPTPAAAPFSLPPTAVPAGPWLDGAASLGVGPIRFVAFPDPEAVERFREQVDRDLGGWRFLGAGRPWLVALLLVAVALPSGLQPAAVGGLALVLLANLGYLVSRSRVLRPTRSVWVVGDHGLVSWRPGRSAVVYWHDLGRVWSEPAEVPPAERRLQRLPILLALENTRRQRCYVTELHDPSGALVALIRTAIARRGSPFALAPQPPLPPPSRAIRAGPTARSRSTAIATTPRGGGPPPDVERGPWLDDPRLAAIGPVRLVCRETDAARVGLVAGLVGLALAWGVVLLIAGHWVPWAAMPPGLPLLLTAGLVGWWLGLVALLAAHAWRRFATRWLLGRDGIARWRAGRLLVLPWRVLVSAWGIEFRKATRYGPPERIRLTRGDGTVLELGPNFTDADEVILRVLRVKGLLAALDPEEPGHELLE